MLLKNKADLNKYAEANQSLKYETVRPSIDTAETEFLIPVIGRTQYDILDAGWNADPVSLNAIQTDLLVKAQKALASYTLYEYTPFAEVQISDAGLRTNRTENNPGAFKYQVENLRNGLLSRAHKYLEEMLEHLEKNIGLYPDWGNSKEFNKYRSLFITTGGEFKEHYPNLEHPRQLYLKLLPSFYLIEELTISPSIGDDFYKSLKAKSVQTNPTFTAYEKELLEFLKKAIAYLTITNGIPQLNVRIDNNGISILNQNTDTSTSASKRKSAEDNHLAMLIKNTYEMGQRWLSKAVAYLNENAVNIPAYDPNHNKITESDNQCSTCSDSPCTCSSIHNTKSSFSM